MLTFGVRHFYRLDLRKEPHRAIEAVDILQGLQGSESIFVQGMHAGTDRFSRRQKLDSGTRERVREAVNKGAYSSLLAFAGEHDAPSATLDLEIFPKESGDEYPQDVTLIARLGGAEDLEEGEPLAERLWDICGPSYGFSVLGAEPTIVQQELSGVPIANWKAPRNIEEERRLLRLQRLRPSLGRWVRGPSWGTYLSESLVNRLGGYAALEEGAPVWRVRALKGGGAYLRLSQEISLLGSTDYQSRAARLAEYLAPITARTPDGA